MRERLKILFKRHFPSPAVSLVFVEQTVMSEGGDSSPKFPAPTMELPLGSGESRNDVHVGLSQPRPQQSLSVQEQRDLSGFPQGIRFGGGILQQAVNQFSRVSSAV
mmetsp:Transcript_26193/g.51426  ORF Transcript_26193/g.51426 Transcript_26193/m.51426 type:complete len:106 (-) Transcript_26193:492-809(-)